jgi:hypothetical protein
LRLIDDDEVLQKLRRLDINLAIEKGGLNDEERLRALNARPANDADTTSTDNVVSFNATSYKLSEDPASAVARQEPALLAARTVVPETPSDEGAGKSDALRNLRAKVFARFHTDKGFVELSDDGTDVFLHVSSGPDGVVTARPPSILQLGVDSANAYGLVRINEGATRFLVQGLSPGNALAFYNKHKASVTAFPLVVK